jgi:hypothetical protein
MWSLAIGLFFISVLASTVQVSAAMPKSAKVTQTQMEHIPKLPMVTVACIMPVMATHRIARCTIDSSTK